MARVSFFLSLLLTLAYASREGLNPRPRHSKLKVAKVAQLQTRSTSTAHHKYHAHHKHRVHAREPHGHQHKAAAIKQNTSSRHVLLEQSTKKERTEQHKSQPPANASNQVQKAAQPHQEATIMQMISSKHVVLEMAPKKKRTGHHKSQPQANASNQVAASSSSMLPAPGLAQQKAPAAIYAARKNTSKEYLRMWDEGMRRDLMRGGPIFWGQGVVPNDDDVFKERPLPYNLRITALLVLFAAMLAAFSMAMRELTKPGDEEKVKVPKQGFTKWQAILAITNIMVGCCLLAVPFCLTRAGPLGFAALALVGAVMCVSALLIGRCIEAVGETAQGRAVNPNQRDWLLVCRLAFGPFGAIVSLVIMPMEIFFHILNCVLSAGHLLPAVLPVGLMSMEGCTVAIGCVSFLLCMLPAKHLPGLSAIGTATQVSLLVFLGVTAMLLVWMTPETIGNTWGGGRSATSVLSVFGVFFGAFDVHAMLPFFYSRLQDKNDWDSVMTVSMTFSTAFCALIGFICFVMFGIHTKEVFAENLGHTSTGMVIEGFEFMGPIGCGLLLLQQLSMVPAGWQALTSMASSKMEMTRPNEVSLGVFLLTLSTLVAVAGSRVLPYVIAIEGDFVDFPIGVVIPVLAFLAVPQGSGLRCWLPQKSPL